jgi:c-di-GMP-binding flagellar brake protein YcgR
MSDGTQDVERYLNVGTPAILHTEPHRKDGPRYRTVIRGWQKGSYVMLDMPADDEIALVRGQPCVVRFVADGDACGFDARAQNWGSRIHPYFRVNWPRHIEVVSVRKHERIEAMLPCTIVLDDESSQEGEIRDLSGGGCGVFLSQPQPVGARLRACFRLPDGTNIENLACAVRNVRPDPAGAFHGCEFEEDQTGARNDLDFFVSTTLERLRVTTRATQRVLFLANDPEDVAVLLQLLLS